MIFNGTPLWAFLALVLEDMLAAAVTAVAADCQRDFPD